MMNILHARRLPLRQILARRGVCRRSVWSLVVLLLLPLGALGATTRAPVSLTLVPPSPITDQVQLDIRGAIWNDTSQSKTFAVRFSLDQESSAGEN